LTDERVSANIWRENLQLIEIMSRRKPKANGRLATLLFNIFFRKVYTMKLLLSKSVLFFLGLLIVLCYSCAPKEQAITERAGEPKVTEPKPIEVKPIEVKPVEVKPVAAKEKQKEQPVGPSTVVGKIGDYVITRGELEKRVVTELRSNPDEYVKDDGSIDTKAVLLKMIAEKAMMIDAREQNFLEEKHTKTRLKQFKERRLATLLLQKELQDKIEVTESEIKEKMRSNPKWRPAQARAIVEKEKAQKLTDQFYERLYKKLHVQKLSANFAKAARIHQRLLLHPREQQRITFIKKKQVEEELTPEEKNLVLATYDNGKVTLEDWFYALCRPSPPRRPKDLHTEKGVERFLDKVLRLPVFLVEARLRGLDKDEAFVKLVRQQEDLTLMRKVRNAKYKEVKKPTKDEISLYFNQNKEKFKTPETVRIDQIWCQDLKTAHKVKDELSSGREFESVKQAYSLEKKAKPFSTQPKQEGIFFEDLWKGEPNQVVGPIKGFYRNQIKWRIVKILGKKPSKVREYSTSIERELISRMRYEQREAIMAKYRKELLEKYPYEIYPERIKDINPLNIP